MTRRLLFDALIVTIVQTKISSLFSWLFGRRRAYKDPRHLALISVFTLPQTSFASPHANQFQAIVALIASSPIRAYSSQEIYKYDESVADEDYLAELFQLLSPIHSYLWDLASLVSERIEEVRSSKEVVAFVTPHVARLLAQYFYQFWASEERNVVNDDQQLIVKLLFLLPPDVLRHVVLLAEPYFAHMSWLFIATDKIMRMESLRAFADEYFCCFYHNFRCLDVSSEMASALSVIVNYFYAFATVCWEETRATELSNMVKALSVVTKWRDVVAEDSLILNRFLDGCVKVFSGASRRIEDAQCADLLVEVGWNVLNEIRCMVDKVAELKDTYFRTVARMMTFVVWVLRQYPLIHANCPRRISAMNVFEVEPIPDFVFVGDSGKSQIEYEGVCYPQEWNDEGDENEILAYDNVNVCNVVKAARDIIAQLTTEESVTFLIEVMLHTRALIKSMRQAEGWDEGVIYVVLPFVFCQMLRTLDSAAVAHVCETTDFWPFILEDQALTMCECQDDCKKMLDSYHRQVWLLLRHCFLCHKNSFCIFEAISRLCERVSDEVLDGCLSSIHLIFLDAPFDFNQTACEAGFYEIIVRRLLDMQAKQYAERKNLIVFLRCLLSTDCVRAVFFTQEKLTSFIFHQLFDFATMNIFLDVITYEVVALSENSRVFRNILDLFEKFRDHLSDSRWQNLVAKLLWSLENGVGTKGREITAQIQSIGLLGAIAFVPQQLVDANKQIFDEKQFDTPPYEICNRVVCLYGALGKGDVQTSKMLANEVYPVLIETFRAIDIGATIVQSLLEIVFEVPILLDQLPRQAFVRNEWGLALLFNATEHLTIFPTVLAFLTRVCLSSMPNKMRLYHIDLPHMLLDFIANFPIDERPGSLGSKATTEAMRLLSVICQESLKLSTLFRMFQLLRPIENKMSWLTPCILSMLPAFLEPIHESVPPAFFCFSQNKSCFEFPPIRTAMLRKGWSFTCDIEIENIPSNDDQPDLIFLMECRSGERFRVFIRHDGVLEFRFCHNQTVVWKKFSDKHEFKPEMWYKLTFVCSKYGFLFYVNGDIKLETSHQIVFGDELLHASFGNVLMRSNVWCLNVSYCYLFGIPLEGKQVVALNELHDDHASGFSHMERNLNPSLPECLFNRAIEDSVLFGYSAAFLSEANVCSDLSVSKVHLGSCTHSGIRYEAGSSTVETVQVAGGLKLFLPLLDQVNYPIHGREDAGVSNVFVQDLVNVFEYGFTASALLEEEFIKEGGLRVFAYCFMSMTKSLFSQSLLDRMVRVWKSLHTVEHRREMLRVIWGDYNIWLRMSEECQIYLWEQVMPVILANSPSLFVDVLPVGTLVQYISQQPMLQVQEKMWKIVCNIGEEHLTTNDLETLLIFCFYSYHQEFQTQLISVLVTLVEKDSSNGLVYKFCEQKGCFPFIELLQSSNEVIREKALSMIFYMIHRGCVQKHLMKRVVLHTIASYNPVNSGNKVWSCLLSGVLIRKDVQRDVSHRFEIWCGLSHHFPAIDVTVLLEALQQADNICMLFSFPLWYFYFFYATLQGVESVPIFPAVMRRIIDEERPDIFTEAMSFLELLFFIGYDASGVISEVLLRVCDSPIMVSSDAVRDMVLTKIYNYLFLIFEPERYTRNVQLVSQYGHDTSSGLRNSLSRISFEDYLSLFTSYTKPIRRSFGCRIDENGCWHDRRLAEKFVRFGSEHIGLLKAKTIEYVALAAAYLRKIDGDKCCESLINWIEPKIVDEHIINIYQSFIGIKQTTDASLWLAQQIVALPQFNKTQKMETLSLFNKIHSMRGDFLKITVRQERLEQIDAMLLNMKQDQRRMNNLALKAHCNLSRSLILNGGPWCESSSLSHWRIDPRLDLAQRHILLRPNRYFSSHMDASRKRDSASAQEAKQNWMDSDVRQKIFDPLKEDMLDNFQRQDRASEFETEAKMITMCAIFDGKFYLTNEEIIFDGDQLNDSLSHFIGGSISKTVVFSLRDITWVLWRAYVHIDQGLEFFLQNGRSYFFFFNGNERKRIIQFISGLKLPNIKIIQKREHRHLIEDLKLTETWLSGAMSTYEYIMFINLFAGRSVNDLSQYPVFPWILKDYTSEVLNIEDPAIYRDLSKPVGALNEQRLMRLKNDVDGCPESYAKCLYRLHYSQAYNVLHFMIRVEPFTTMHIQMQDGRFDNPNRLFKSIARSHYLACDSMTNDYRELIPEFFTFPDFLINADHFDLGVEPSDVELPTWADSPDDFIMKHRMALESDYVASHINEWIDLIFGVKQRGKAAIEANNTFHAFCYSDIMTEEVRSNPELFDEVRSHAMSFGITPEQVFYAPHPPRPSHVTLLPQRIHMPEFHKVVAIDTRTSIQDFASWSDGSLRIVTRNSLFSLKDNELKRMLLPYQVEDKNSVVLASKVSLLIACDKTMYGFHVHTVDSLGHVFSHRQKFSKFLKFIPVDNSILSVCEDGTTLLWDVPERSFGPIRYRVNHHFTRIIDVHASKLLGLGVSCDIHRQVVIWDLISGTYVRSFEVDYVPSRVLLVDAGFVVLMKENPRESSSLVQVYALNHDRLLSTFTYPKAITSVVPMNFASGLSFLAVAFDDRRVMILTMPRNEVWISASFESIVLSMKYDAAKAVLYLASINRIISLTV